MSAPKLAGRRIRHGRKALVLAVIVTAGCGAATPPGTAIWVLQTQTSASSRLAWRSTIWRWSGGPPVQVRTLPPVTQPPAGYELTDVAW